MAESVQMKVKLTLIDDIKTFVKKVENLDFDVDLVSGRYIIDAKSLLGIMSLDLSKPINLTLHADPDRCDEFINWLGASGILVK